MNRRGENKAVWQGTYKAAGLIGKDEMNNNRAIQDRDERKRKIDDQIASKERRTKESGDGKEKEKLSAEDRPR